MAEAEKTGTLVNSSELRESRAPSSVKDNVQHSVKHNKTRIRVLVLALAVCFALALGLGLGFGLKKSTQSAVPSSPRNTTTASADGSQASTLIPEWRSYVNDYNLDLDSWRIDAVPTTRSYNLTLREITLAPDGVSRTVLAINGKFPGPVIRANRGDRLLINVENQMSNATAIHWHGLFQNGSNWMDGTAGITQCPIAPNTSFLYNFTLENQFGTYWYHAHYASQNIDGVVGPLIIHAPEEKEMQKLYDYDQIILITDWYHDLSAALLPGYLSSGAENNEPVPDSGLIQGTNYFNCSTLDDNHLTGYDCSGSARSVFAVEQGKRYRYRLINTGAFAMFEFSIDNHPLSVIEADGTPTEPLNVHRLEIAVAQRYSIIVSANQTARNYWIRAQMNTFCFAQTNPILNTNVMALLTYNNSTSNPTNSSDWADILDAQCQDLNSTRLVPSIPEDAPPPTRFYSLVTSFQIGAYALDRAYINGTSWQMSANNPTLRQAVAGLHSANMSTFDQSGVSSPFSAQGQYVISIPNYEVVDLLITNFDDGAHPFHFHGHVFWVIASSDQQYFDWSTYQTKYNKTLENPLRRDTVTVDAYGWTMIRFKADNPGLWAFHCHVAWHMEAGLLMQFQTRSDLMKAWELPQDVQQLCSKAS